MLAMVMCQGDNFGGTLYQARNRILGTMAGAIYSYFVFIAVGADLDKDIYPIIGMLVPWVFLCMIVKQNKAWSYFGSISITTALMITFGRNQVLVPIVGDYVLLRVQENAVGIMLAFTITLLTFPLFAIEGLKMNISEVLSKLSSAASKELIAFTTTLSKANEAVSPQAWKTNNNNNNSNTYDNNNDVSSNLVVIGSAEDANMVVDVSNNTLEVEEGDLDNNDVCYTLDDNEMLVIENSKKIQKLTYIAAETMFISFRISQQPPLLDQSAMELIFWSKPFPDLTYQKLITCQNRILHMMVSIDRTLLRISQISELKVAESSFQFGEKVSEEVKELLTSVTSNLAKWSKQLQYSVDKKVPVVAENLPSTVDNLSKDHHYAVDKVDTRAAAYHVESRREHVLALEKMHKASLRLMANCHLFNNVMFKGWLDTMAHASDSTTTAYNNIVDTHRSSTAHIHYLFDVLTTFNSLFYASNHLAIAAMDLGNIMYTILTLENKSNHKSY